MVRISLRLQTVSCNLLTVDGCRLSPDLSFPETVRSSYSQADPPGNLPLLDSAYLNRHISLCFRRSENNIFRCAYSSLVLLMREHGIDIGSRSISETRQALCYHIVTGMCCAKNGERCKDVARDLSQNGLKNCILQTVSLLCLEKELNTIDVRFMCFAIGVSVPVDSSLDDCLHLFMSATLDTSVFDLQSYFSKYDTASKEYTYQWCSAHGLHPSGNHLNVKLQLLKHVLHAECNLSGVNADYSACHSVRTQTVQSFEDADKKAFVLSIVCVLVNVSLKTLRLVAEIITECDFRASP